MRVGVFVRDSGLVMGEAAGLGGGIEVRCGKFSLEFLDSPPAIRVKRIIHGEWEHRS